MDQGNSLKLNIVYWPIILNTPIDSWRKKKLPIHSYIIANQSNWNFIIRSNYIAILGNSAGISSFNINKNATLCWKCLRKTPIVNPLPFSMHFCLAQMNTVSHMYTCEYHFNEAVLHISLLYEVVYPSYEAFFYILVPQTHIPILGSQIELELPSCLILP